MKDVAQRAGVSVATVSAVINETQTRIPVSDASRQRVLEAIADLNYQVNEQARNLRTGKSYMIGVAVSGITQPFSGEMLRMVEKAVRERDYGFLIWDVENNRHGEQRYLTLFQQQRVDGILFIGATHRMADTAITSLIESGTPVVLTEREAVGQSVPCVLVDNVAGAALAAEHLIALGHEEIVCVAGPEDNLIAKDRIAGYEQAMRQHTRGECYDVVAGGITMMDGYEAMIQLLTRRQRPRAVVMFNDSLALGAMRAVREHGLRIPNDIALVGYDDIPMAAYCEPPLTTVRQPVLQMCQEGVGLLLDVLEGTYPKDYYRKVVLQPELVVRETCGSARHTDM